MKTLPKISRFHEKIFMIFLLLLLDNNYGVWYTPKETEFQKIFCNFQKQMKKFSCEKTIDKPKWIWYNWQTEPQTDFDQTESPLDGTRKKAGMRCLL